MERIYRPGRDRGVYRAAANVKSPNHKWAKDLIDGLLSGNITGLLKWCYRAKGKERLMEDLVYSKNPLFDMLGGVEDLSSAYLSIPLKTYSSG